MNPALLRFWLDLTYLLAAGLMMGLLAVQAARRRPEVWPAALALAILVVQALNRLLVALPGVLPAPLGTGPMAPVLDRALDTLFLILLVYGLVRPLVPTDGPLLRWLLASHLGFLGLLALSVAADYGADWTAASRFASHWGARSFDAYQVLLLLVALGVMLVIYRSSRARYALLAVLALALWLLGHVVHLVGLVAWQDTAAIWGLLLRLGDLAALTLLAAAILLPDPVRRSLTARYLADATTLVGRLQAEIERLNAAKAVLEERQRLARELHDSVSQALFSIELNAGAIEALLEKNPPKAREQLTRLRTAAHEALTDLRALLADLHPPALQGQPLAEALAGYATTLTEREGLPVAVQTRIDGQLDAESEAELFRIGYEALTNVVRHAEARQVWVDLTVHGPAFRLRVADDGVGLPAEGPETAANGHDRTFGVSGMRERATLLGARLTIGPRPGGGTEVLVER